MKDDIIKPFVDASIKVIQTMAFLVPVAGESKVWDGNELLGEVMGLIGLSNEKEKIKGFMAVGFEESSIVQVVSNMLGEEFTTITSDVREAVGEIANMICGQARQGLSASGIKLQASLPSVISGKDLKLNGTEKAPLLILPFQVEKGPFEVILCIEGLD